MLNPQPSTPRDEREHFGTHLVIIPTFLGAETHDIHNPQKEQEIIIATDQELSRQC
jgi:hypothetical protein